MGGGYIGLELGMFYAKIGTQVTVVEATPSLLRGVDPDLVKGVLRKLEKLNVPVYLNTMIQACQKKSSQLELTLIESGVEGRIEGQAQAKERTMRAETLLVTIGRKPNSDQLNLEKAGLKTDRDGFLSVDAQRRTAVAHIYAVGDIAGQPLLAHKGSKEGIVAAEAIAGLKTQYDVVAIPAVIFTDPEIATVGLSETEAKNQALDVQVGTFPFAANGRALSLSEPDGFVKMIGDSKTGRLLGVHIVGPEASNLISEAALALEMGACVEDIALTVHPHPTLPEALMEAAEATLGHAIHIFKPRVSK
jgi:dihydrolipoamide dehydrogenase